MLLAGDVGGTSTRLGLFEATPGRPRPLEVRAFDTLDFGDLSAIVEAFIAATGTAPAAITAACFGVAGPVVGDAAQLTNVPWLVEAGGLAAAFGFPRVALLNDLQALAHAVPVLADAELHTLQPGDANADGNRALIAAGTGLGTALLLQVDDRFIPSPSEGGHADFAARTEREIALLRDVTARYGRAAVEHVVSGPGLVNIHRVTHATPCRVVTELATAGAPAAISEAGLERRCAGCVEALEQFVDAYGAEAGNLALRTMATGGVYIGGGIAPKILPALAAGGFMKAFRAKAPFESMLGRIPVRIILNDEAGLLGAAVCAARA